MTSVHQRLGFWIPIFNILLREPPVNRSLAKLANSTKNVDYSFPVDLGAQARGFVRAANVIEKNKAKSNGIATRSSAATDNT